MTDPGVLDKAGSSLSSGLRWRTTAIVGVSILVLGVFLIWGFTAGWIAAVPPVLQDFFRLLKPFAPYSTAVVAAIAGLIAWRSHSHRRLSDNRAEWWRRTQYTLDLLMSSDDPLKRNTGMSLLGHIIADPTATQADAALLKDTVNALVTDIINQQATKLESDTATQAGRRGWRWRRP
ncbi:hypothetical protein ACI7YT_10100 [Microbacterium sp. M]|uniref:hypothetical protein n=1 Tax=Microbacterium sp. M TaxID=3377125 RepID=UPI00387094B9